MGGNTVIASKNRFDILKYIYEDVLGIILIMFLILGTLVYAEEEIENIEHFDLEIFTST